VLLGFMPGAAMAQEAQVFESTPSLETLRSILVPESAGGTSRRILVPQRENREQAPPLQPAAVPRDQSVPASEPTLPHTGDGASSAPAEPQAHPPTPAAPQQIAQPTGAAAAKRDQAAPGVVGYRINFALNSATIPRSAEAFLDRLAELLKQEPQVKLVIEGHTDAYGSAEYNQQLSQLRAEAVAVALAHRDIGAERFDVVGKGKAEPLVADPYDPQNRRVQFVRADQLTRR
jgi:outer membrane protein OmpA-like peptidoglycan-associated protein